jgi:hypothetical protein
MRVAVVVVFTMGRQDLQLAVVVVLVEKVLHLQFQQLLEQQIQAVAVVVAETILVYLELVLTVALVLLYFVMQSN